MSALDRVSDTSLWVAVYRALESERSDAVLFDPFARALAGERGFEIVSRIPQGMSGSWSVIARSVLFDSWILELVNSRQVSTVVNLACGLDSRPYRLALPSSLDWLEVDFSHVLHYKAEILKKHQPRCRLHRHSCDLSDSRQRESLMEKISDFPEPILVITEGLLVYLTPADATILAQSLHAQNKIRYWISDLNTPAGAAAMQKKWGKDLRAGKSSMQFAPAEGSRFFEERGWRLRNAQSNTAAGRRIHREMKNAWFWRNLGKYFSRDYRNRLKNPTQLLLLERG